ncbi:hypothetical protein RA210_U210001 [Rubrivivax sp. A210]|nr:hypothetical protein RA210_U210001 [Rubrivivax sp. A210]
MAVNAGTLTLAAAGRLSALPATTVAAGATLALAGNETLGNLAGAGNVSLAGATLSSGSLASSEFAGGISGNGNLVKLGAGNTFTLSGANGYTGSTTVAAGTLALSATGTLASGTVNVDAGTLALAAAERLADTTAVNVASGATMTLVGDETVTSLALAGTLGGIGKLSAGTYALNGGSTGATADLGTGTLTATGASSLAGSSAAGNVTVNGGTLTLAAADRLSASPAVNVAAGASLALAGDQTLGSLAGAGTIELAAFLLRTGTLGDSSFDGVIAGTGGIAKQGSSSFTLNGANTYTGNTRVEAGTLALSATGTLASGSVSVDAGTLALAAAERLANGAAVNVASGAALTLAGNETIAGLALAGTLGGNGTLSAASYALNGGTVDANLGSGALTSTGASRLNGSAAADTVAVNAGTLTLAAAGRLSALPATTVAAGATLALAGNETLGNLAGAGTVNLGSATLSSGRLASSEFAGAISGSGNLVKQGAASTFTLSGANGYTGSTTVAAGTLALSATGTLASGTVNVDAGTLALAAAERLANTAALSVASGATMTLAGDETVASLALAGTLGGTGRLTAATYALDGGTANADLGAGTLTSTGASTLVGASDAASVTVSRGTLTLAAADRLNDAATLTVDTGATLALNGNDRVDNLGLSGTLAGSGTLTAARYALAGGTATANLGAGALTSTGASTLAGTSAADTVAVSNGTLALASAGRLVGPAAVNVAAGATLAMTGDQGMGSLAGSGSVTLGGFTLATGALGDSEFAGDISGSGGLVKQGGSSFTLSGSNSYTGITTVAAGVLQVGDGTTRGSLSSSGYAVSGTLRSARSDAVALAAPVSGSGELEQAGSGVLTLSGSNKTYSGRTLVTRGELATAGNEDLPDGSLVEVAAAGRLTLGGSETLRGISADGSVALAGNLTASEDLLLRGAVTVPGGQALTLTAQRITAASDDNRWGSSVAIDARDAVTLSSGREGGALRDLVLGTTTVDQGGHIEAGTLRLAGATTINGGTLELVATQAATPTAPGAELDAKQAGSSPLSLAANVVDQDLANGISLAAGAGLRIQASGGGSVRLASLSNRFLGDLEILSGAAYNTAWVPTKVTASFNGGPAVEYTLQSKVALVGSTINVGGIGIEADVVAVTADLLATTGADSRIAARLPFDNSIGTVASLPGLTLELTDASFLLQSPFGQNGGEIRIDVGSRSLGNRSTPLDAGYVTVLPRGGAKGSTSVLLNGPEVSATGYRFFFDGAGVQSEVPVFYNGLLPVSPQVENSISATVSVSEGARKERFDEAIRTENVAVRLRAGVIAEVGPGRPATVGSEGLRSSTSCTQTKELACEAP